MALTKVTKSGITDNAIDADKIENGTILDADITPGTITNAKLAGSIANDKLANSSLTINGSSVSLGSSISAGALDWQAVITADGSTTTTGVAGRGYFINTTNAAHTFTLPGSPTIGATIAIVDYAGTFATNKLTIARNGNNIQGAANNSQISTNRASVTLVYVDATRGWVYQNESNVADLIEALYISATGGTVTTSGNFKIHTFTGDGCFVVATVGNPAGSTAVDYLVVAGGGAGGSSPQWNGGGGAGGFRVSNSYGLPAPTTSPLANPVGITVTTTTYPITVGGGGAPVSPTNRGTSGSPSVFSTITSTGGGGGGSQSSSPTLTPGLPGGSGGGSGEGSPIPSFPVGAGNTPPVSPPQGNPGGAGSGNAGSGGGGAGAAGQGGGPSGTPTLSAAQGGNGGVGSFISPSFAVNCSGTPGPAPAVRYFGGGGGGGAQSNDGVQGLGGSGGGGAGADYPSTNAVAGTANTGGGGGGSAYQTGTLASGGGGKGIVIIRYKFQ